MRMWVLVAILFTSNLMAAPLEDVTVLQPVSEKYFDPYVWWQNASCSTDGNSLIVYLGKRYLDPHFAGSINFQVKLSSLPQWNNQRIRAAFGSPAKNTRNGSASWMAPKISGSLEFTNRKGVTFATDDELGGCEMTIERETDKKKLAISLVCYGLPVSQMVPGIKYSAGRMSFAVPEEHPIVCKDILP